MLWLGGHHNVPGPPFQKLTDLLCEIRENNVHKNDIRPRKQDVFSFLPGDCFLMLVRST